MANGALYGAIIAIGVALTAAVSATAQQPQVTVFNNPVGIETNPFADYPCSDAVAIKPGPRHVILDMPSQDCDLSPSSLFTTRRRQSPLL